jgi:hypothetical protein
MCGHKRRSRFNDGIRASPKALIETNDYYAHVVRPNKSLSGRTGKKVSIRRNILHHFLFSLPHDFTKHAYAKLVRVVLVPPVSKLRCTGFDMGRKDWWKRGIYVMYERV